MSDIDDLATYSPTTPHVTKKTKSGPLRKNKATGKRLPSNSPEMVQVEDDSESMNVDEDKPPPKLKRKAATVAEDDDDPPPPTPPLSSKLKAAPRSKQARAAKAKGKTKSVVEANPPKSKNASSTPITVDESEEEAPESIKKPSPPNKKPAVVKQGGPSTSSVNDKKIIRELERRNEQLERTTARLTKELEAARLACEHLTKQFEELSRVRMTEPESLLQQIQEQHEATVTAQNSLVDELKQQLSAVEPFKQLGNSRTLDYVKREDVNRGNQELVERLAKCEKDMAAKDAQIRELQLAEKNLQTDLENEIKHSQTLAAKANKGGKQEAGPMSSSDSKKYAATVRFYEDLTNLIIPNVKFMDSAKPGERDITYTCVYSAAADDEDPSPALNFTLKFCSEPEEGHQAPFTRETPFIDVISYTPLNLELESDEFVEKLKFLGSSFSFKKEQLSLLLSEMHKLLNPDDEDENDSSKDTQAEASKEPINVDSD